MKLLSGGFAALKTGFFTGSFWLLTYNLAWAASENLNLDTDIDPVATPMPSMLSLMVKLIVSLMVVGGLAYLTVRFLKKNTQVAGSSESITVLDQFAMGMNKGLFIVDVAGRVLVLGVTDHNINVLYELQDTEHIDDLRAKANERMNQPIIPPKFLELVLSKTKGSKIMESSFSSHIQQQIKKLQDSAESSTINSRGRDEQDEQR